MMRLKHMTLVCAAALVCMTGCNGTADISKFSPKCPGSEHGTGVLQS